MLASTVAHIEAIAFLASPLIMVGVVVLGALHRIRTNTVRMAAFRRELGELPPAPTQVPPTPLKPGSTSARRTKLAHGRQRR